MSRDEVTHADDVFRGGGDMGARMRTFDWSATPLGPFSEWTDSLRSALSICLGSRFPMALYWGPSFTLLYNDAWSPIPGAKHPAALGRPGSEVWPELWDSIGPMYESVLRTGEAIYAADSLLVMERNGYTEECYFNYNMSPVRGVGGRIEGVFNAVIETTFRVIEERRTAVLGELATRISGARSPNEVCARAAAILSAAQHDVPFAALYLRETAGREARLAASVSIARGSRAAPESIALGETEATWPLWRIEQGATRVEVRGLVARCGDELRGGAWPEKPDDAMLVPVRVRGGGEAAAFLVIGASPRRAVDERYWQFVERAAEHIGTSLSSAMEYEIAEQRAEALAEIDRAKTEFFSNVSHEFRTPLTLLLGPLEDALATSDRALRGDELATAHRNGQRLLRLVNTLLDFSRIEAGRMQATFAPTDLVTLTTELASAFRAAVEKAGLILTVESEALPAPVYVDPALWEKIVLNLLSNAFKFTFEGAITVSFRTAGERVVVDVRDTGTGIPASELPHLFERFHRVAGARSRSFEGSGIGLALVRQLVQLHGGTIDVRSVVGEGTTFSIQLPFGSAHLAKEHIGNALPSASRGNSAAPFVQEALRWIPGEQSTGRVETADAVPGAFGARGATSARIVLADDNADMRAYISRLLTEQGWQVESVADGEAALAAVRANRPDLVLSDVMMPGLDGFGLVKALRSDATMRTVPIVLVSARAGEEAVAEALRAGADDYIVKPFSAKDLLVRVSTRIAAARSLRAANDRIEQARLEAENANRLKDEFLATMSHELRTPLNAILGWTRMLRGGMIPEAKRAQTLETIERNARAQVVLVDDILDISRIVSGKLRLAIDSVDLVAVVGAAVDSVRPAAEAKGVTLRVDFGDGPLTLRGDADRLQQVAWNLLSNAVKFTPRGGSVLTRMIRRDDAVDLVVQDTGEGIASSFLPHVFERFRQADASITRVHGGLGLGLSIVKHLVELHGGTIRAESGGVGEGATFTATFPVGAARQPTHAGLDDALRSDEAPAAKGMQVLVVDDEPDALDLTRAALESIGIAVRVSSSAAEALEALRASPPDVLLADVGMPGIDGYALLRSVRALGDSLGMVPAIAVSASARGDDRSRALRAGFDDYIAKPVDPHELLRVIARYAPTSRR